MKVALAMIVGGSKNNPVLLRRALESIKDQVDGIYITVTDGNKETIAVAEEFGAVVSYYVWDKNFAKARQFNFDQVPEDYQYIFWMDDDDIFRGERTIREIAGMAAKSSVDAVFLDYWYQVDTDEKGEVTDIVIQHPRERIIRNSAFYWESHLHEVLIEKYETKKVLDDSAVLVHLPEEGHGDMVIHRNTEILEKQVADEKGKDPRTLYYLAKAYYDTHEPGKLDKAEKLLKDYLTMSGWDEERAQAREYLHFIYREQDKIDDAITELKRAIMEEHYKFPSLYVNLAACYLMKDDIAAAKHWIEIALHVKDPRTTTIKNPKEVKMRTLEVLYNIALHENDLDKAIQYAEKLYEMSGYEHFERMATIARETKRDNKAAQSLVYLAKYLEDQNQEEKIPFLLKGSPSELQKEPFFAGLVRKYLPSKTWGAKEIAFVANFGGPHFETWSPLSLERGIGGSEEAVIHLSREWTKMGYKVTVYGDPGTEAGEYDGVEYKPWFEFNYKDDFNILIAWRSPFLFKLPIKARKKLIDMHDLFEQEMFEGIEYDKIMVKSKFHRELAPGIADDKIAVISNGISVGGTSKVKRNPQKCIYTSSYDRGLEHLLKIWPEVKKAVPDARLDICYGWDLFDKAYADNPERKAWKARMVEMMQQPGVTEVGRVSHKTVKRMMLASGVFAYPTHFGEINCISAIKAQLYGCEPVVTDFAALSEMVQHGRKIKGDIYEEEVREEYTKQLIEALKNPISKAERAKASSWAEQYAWTEIAKQWETHFA